MSTKNPNLKQPVTPLDAQYAASLEGKRDNYIHRNLVGIDVLANLLADGNSDETISSRMARWATEDKGLKKDIGIAVCDALNVVNKDHGAKAEVSDLGRAERLVEIEKATPTIKQDLK
jgi:hypothetical protein